MRLIAFYADAWLMAIIAVPGTKAASRQACCAETQHARQDSWGERRVLESTLGKSRLEPKSVQSHRLALLPESASCEKRLHALTDHKKPVAAHRMSQWTERGRKWVLDLITGSFTGADSYCKTLFPRHFPACKGSSHYKRKADGRRQCDVGVDVGEGGRSGKCKTSACSQRVVIV